MTHTSFRLAAAFAAGLLAFCCLAPRAIAADTAMPSSQSAAGLLRDPRTQVLGNPLGDVTIVEFFDYNCPFCKAVEPRLVALLASDRGVRLIVKEFPILSPDSVVASRAALASVKQGRYAQFHQALMSRKGHVDEAVIFEVAKDVGLDLARLRKDMQSPEIAEEVAANVSLARAIHVTSTPTFFVGDQQLTQPSAQIDFPMLVAAARHGQQKTGG